MVMRWLVVFTTSADFGIRQGVRIRGIGGGRGSGGTLQFVRGSYKSLKGSDLTVVAILHAFLSPCIII